MDILKRNLAPVSASAWQAVDDMARDTLKAHLSARKMVDVTGPMGIDYTCLNLGRLAMGKPAEKSEIRYGVYMVQPLVETRLSFSLKTWELDNIQRGARDIELDSLVDAARKMAEFEETAVYRGFKPGNIAGLHQSAVQGKIALKLDEAAILDGVSEAMTRLQAGGVTGGARLSVNPRLWKFLNRPTPGGTLKNLVEQQIGGRVVYSEYVDTALLVSDRGGDCELILGQDMSIGYHHHTSEEVFLFLTESFTFRVITPEALVAFSL